MRRSFFPRFPIRPSTITSPTSRQFPLRLLQSVIDASNPVLRRTVHSNGSTGPYGIKRVTSVLALFRLRFTPRARRTLLSFCLLRFGDLVWPTRLPLPPCHPSLPSSMCHPFSPLWTDATYALPHCSTAWAFIGYPSAAYPHGTPDDSDDVFRLDRDTRQKVGEQPPVQSRQPKN